MIYYILRRLVWSVLTVFGVMLLTFFLFRSVGGDIASAWKGAKAPAHQKAEWNHKYGYDRPLYINVHSRLVLLDHAGGNFPLHVEESRGSNAIDALLLISPTLDEVGEMELEGQARDKSRSDVQALVGRYVWRLDRQTPVVAPAGQPSLTDGEGLLLKPRKKAVPATGPAAQPAPPPPVILTFWLSDGTSLDVNLSGAATTGELIDLINNHGDNRGRLRAGISEYRWTHFFRSQFFHHLATSATFSSVSLKNGQKLTEIIGEHMGYSLAIMVPAMAIGWFLDLVIASFVAYYRGSLVDRIGVFLAVLGMCIPVLAFMMYGQALMYRVYPECAYGVDHRVNVYLPVAILVVAGMGAGVRFYRTIILDETNREYVRTAKAKGLPLHNILFKHVLKNCMLPILTSLVMSIPFLIMGNLILEQYFGVPGLGDLLLQSFTERNEPILNGLVFLLSVMYTASVLITDICYGIFDPRIRLR